MKIPAIKTNIQPKKTLLKKVKTFFREGIDALKYLTEDVFEAARPRPYVIVNGKKVYRTKHVMIDGKKVPKSELKFGTWDEADMVGITVKHINLYPDDLKKMEKMSLEEAKIYQRKLIEENRFYYDNEDILKKK